jgi:hypothetical protein
LSIIFKLFSSPTLEKLKEVADRAHYSASMVTLKPKAPNHFICPILQVVKYSFSIMAFNNLLMLLMFLKMLIVLDLI